MSSSIPPDSSGASPDVSPGASPADLDADSDSDSQPGTLPGLPDVALWGESDVPVPTAQDNAFAGLVAKPSENPLPTIGHIGRYALKYQLGEGGLGTVYAAHDPLLSRLIAVKTLNLTIEDNEREAFNALFLNEARAAGGLSHPHIVTVFDAGVSDKRAYIAMELLKGRDLRQLRQEGWRATPAQAALIVRRVADALAFAHSKGVIHRDVKPANIFMVGRTQPRVLDFGIARVAHRQEINDAMLGAGSPYYMAPEQFRREAGDRRCDVFSLGVVLYELLTDTKPFRGDSLQEIANAVLVYEPPSADKVEAAVPKELAEIAARAMAKDPDQRFRSARSLARELRQWLDANPTGPEGEPLVARPPPPPARRRWVAWASAVVGVAALGSIAAAVFSGDVVDGTARWKRAVDTAIEPSGSRSVATSAATPVAPPESTSATTVPKGAAAASVIGDRAAIPAAVEASPAMTAAAPTSLAASTTSTAAAASPDAADSLVLSSLTPISKVPLPSSSTVAATTAAPSSGASVAVVAAATVKESARDKRSREKREKEARDREARATVPAAPAVAAPTGTVRIAVSPWGEVEVDGTRTGAAPPLAELTLPEGRHVLVVRNGDFTPLTTAINVVAGQTITLRHKFGS